MASDLSGSQRGFAPSDLTARRSGVRTDDLDPSRRTLLVRAETTKGRRERIVPYSATRGALMQA